MEDDRTLFREARADDAALSSEMAVAASRWGGVQAPAATAAIDAPATTPATWGALPDYLVRHYWWAYLWRPAVWFFDHQPIINAIVFGQYSRLTDETVRMLDPARAGATLMIASAYGKLIPSLAARLDGNLLSVVDVAPIQLERAQAKLAQAGLADRVRLEPMNAEELHYDDASFDSALMFLLLHELPTEPRRRALTEALRVVRPGGRLVLAEYGADTRTDPVRTHPFHRWAPLRWIFGTAEPFLPSLWREDLDALLGRCAAAAGRRVVCEERVLIFGAFYRILRYRVEQA